MKNLMILLLMSFFIAIGIQLPNNYISMADDNIVDYNNDNYTLIVNILKDANKDTLIPYANLINLETIKYIPNSTSNKIAYILSLPQQFSFIAIYDTNDNSNYIFEGIIDNLSNIKNFYFYKNFIVVEQFDSDPSTNFTQREFLEIFFNKNNTYVPVFSKNIYMEKIIKNTNSDNNDVLKEIEISSIDYLEGDLPRVLCINTITSYKGIYVNLTNSYEFIENKKTTKKEIYEWNPDIECFSIKKNSK